MITKDKKKKNYPKVKHGETFYGRPHITKTSCSEGKYNAAMNIPTKPCDQRKYHIGPENINMKLGLGLNSKPKIQKSKHLVSANNS